MGGSKVAGVVAAVVVGLSLVGVVIYEQGPAATRAPTTSASVAQPYDYAPNAEQLAAIRAARYECFPPEVVTRIMETTTRGIDLIDPEHKLPWQVLTVGIDRQGQCWMGFLHEKTGDGTGRAELDNFSPPRIMGVVTEAGEAIPVRMIPHGRGGYTCVAQFSDPWPVGETRTLALLGSIGWVRPEDGYNLHLSNNPGANKIQQIVVVMTPGWRLESSVEKPAVSAEISGYSIYVWQKHLQDGEELQMTGKLAR